jgi:hypothetical protein
MAKKDKEIKPNVLYKVRLKERVRLLDRQLVPGREYFILGKHLQPLVEQGVIEEWQES